MGPREEEEEGKKRGEEACRGDWVTGVKNWETGEVHQTARMKIAETRYSDWEGQ